MVFDGSSARWKRISPPALRTTVEIFGHCRGVSDTGALMINIDDIAFNLGARMPPEETTNAEGSPSKRRKFAPYATARAPTTAQCVNCVVFPLLDSQLFIDHPRLLARHKLVDLKCRVFPSFLCDLSS